jgi:hypothetical protein
MSITLYVKSYLLINFNVIGGLLIYRCSKTYLKDKGRLTIDGRIFAD